MNANAVVEKINGNAALQAVSRIGVPVLLAATGFLASFVVEVSVRLTAVETSKAEMTAVVDRRLMLLEAEDQRARDALMLARRDTEIRVSVLEGQRSQAAEEISRRLGALEAADARDREVLSQVRSDLAGLRVGQEATLRALESLERSITGRQRSGLPLSPFAAAPPHMESLR